MKKERGLNVFEKYLTVWVILCIGVGILLGKTAPGIAIRLDAMSTYQVSIPIAICLFFMMYPIMVKIDFEEVVRAARTPKPVALTLFINWAIKPFSMYLQGRDNNFKSAHHPVDCYSAFHSNNVYFCHRLLSVLTHSETLLSRCSACFHDWCIESL